MANAPIQLKKVTPGDVVAVPAGSVGFFAGSDGKFYAKDGSSAAAEIGGVDETAVQDLIDTSLEDYATTADVNAAIAPVTSRSGLLASTNDYVRWDAEGGGEFRLSSDQVSSTDNVFRIERNDGTIVERIWDGINFQVEWVPLGVQVGTWGVTSASVNGDKLTAAVAIAPEGCTLQLKPNETYDLDFPMRLHGDLNIQGNNTIIKRRDQRSSLLTANSNAGTSTVTVADGSVFRVGMRVFVVKTSGVLGGHAMVNGTSVMFGSPGFLVTNINGNVITLGGTLQQNCVIGNKLVALDSMMLSDAPLSRLYCSDVTWDGNNISHADVLDWAAGYGISVRFAVFDRCVFKNHPNECCTFSSGTMRDCQGVDLWGSLFHASAANDYPVSGISIERCATSNTNTKDNGHCEGVITFSNRSIDIRVVDCIFDNSAGAKGTGVFGNLDTTAGVADNNFYAENVTARNFGQIIIVTAVSGGEDFDKVHFSRCQFDTCGRLLIQGNNVTKGPRINRVLLENNEFINCWLDVRHTLFFDWVSNVYRWDLYDGVHAGSSFTFAGLPTTRLGGSALAEGDVSCLVANDGANSLGVYVRNSGVWVRSSTISDKLPPAGTFAGLLVTDCGRVSINGGYIGSPGFKYRDQFGVGVFLNVSVFRKTEAGTSTVCYMDVAINGLDLVGWDAGIATRSSAWWAVAIPFDTASWTFSDCRVATIRDNVYVNCLGIEVPSGAEAKICSVYIADTATGSVTIGIKAQGPIDATKTIGGAVIGCYVPNAPGSSQAIRLGLASDNARNKNCIAVGNVIAKAVVLAGTHDSVQANNTVISLAGMTSPTVPPWRINGSNANLY